MNKLNLVNISGQDIRSLRKKHNMSVKELAIRLNVSGATLSQLELYSHRIKEDTATKIQNIFNEWILLCGNCHNINSVWFTTNELWNAHNHGFSILCPNCFIHFAELDGCKPTAWEIKPEEIKS
jgi:transcriptional regulator with XRE-family HTH domain